MRPRRQSSPVGPTWRAGVVLAAAGAAGAAGLVAAVTHPAASPQPPLPAGQATLVSGPFRGPIIGRVVARQLVASQLLAGRLSLAEAVAVFRWLDTQSPPPAASVPRTTPCPSGLEPGPDGWTDDEAIFVSVLAHAVAAADAAPGFGPTLAALAAEFAAWRADGRLPEPPAVSEVGCEWLFVLGIEAAERARVGGPPARPDVSRLQLVAATADGSVARPSDPGVR